MSLEFVFYFSFLLFLLGLFGLLYSSDIVSILISFQFIIISSVINFISFSYFLYQDSVWANIFVFLGMISIYLLMFCIIFYSYLSFNNLNGDLDSRNVLRDFKLFKLDRSDWWGEDNF